MEDLWIIEPDDDEEIFTGRDFDVSDILLLPKYILILDGGSFFLDVCCGSEDVFGFNLNVCFLTGVASNNKGEAD